MSQIELPPGATVVEGAQWGDEGKGKVVDLLAGKADAIARSHGGNNAGHTVINEQGKFALHLVPAGIFHSDKPNLICRGVVIEPSGLMVELDELENRGVPLNNLEIDPNAKLVLPYHRVLDRVYEDARKGQKIGTTGRGIGPTYSDSRQRCCLSVRDLMDPKMFLDKLKYTLEEKMEVLKLPSDLSSEDLDCFNSDSPIYRKMAREASNRFRPFVKDTTLTVERLLDEGKTILVEGAHGFMLDVDFGTVPYVTSSSCTIDGALNGAGIASTEAKITLGVFKAYSTRVGGGPMVTELSDEIGDYLRIKGVEKGTTTGRDRRTGWFDAVAARYARRINRYTHMAITKLDVLDNLEEIKMCVGYEVDGRLVEGFPDTDTLTQCKPVWQRFKGWKEDTTGVRRFEDLPERAREYAVAINEVVKGSRLWLIGVGQDRNAMIVRAA